MPKKMRRRWSPEEKSEIIERFHASGLSREAFGRKEGIAPSVLGNWLRKESNGDHPEQQLGLVSVQVKREEQSDEGLIEIIIGNDRRIRVGKGFDPKLLERVIATLERC